MGGVDVDYIYVRTYSFIPPTLPIFFHFNPRHTCSLLFASNFPSDTHTYKHKKNLHGAFKSNCL